LLKTLFFSRLLYTFRHCRL